MDSVALDLSDHVFASHCGWFQLTIPDFLTEGENVAVAVAVAVAEKGWYGWVGWWDGGMVGPPTIVQSTDTSFACYNEIRSWISLPQPCRSEISDYGILARHNNNTGWRDHRVKGVVVVVVWSQAGSSVGGNRR
jgi:hypothetical protein